MAKVYRDNSETSRSRSNIVTNSVTLANGDFVSIVGGFLAKATTTSRIEGMSNGSLVAASDNQTVAKKTMSYTKASPFVEFECTISGGTITQADEGVSYYNLTTGNVIDGTTESAVGSYIDTTSAAAVDAVVYMQFKLVKFLTATTGIFVANV